MISKAANYWIVFVDKRGLGLVTYAAGATRQRAEERYRADVDAYRKGESEYQHLAGVELRSATWGLIATTVEENAA